MKFLNLAALAASILSAGSSARIISRTRTIILKPDAFEIAVLGGQTFRVSQVPNVGFIAQGRGPRAMARAFSKYGVAVPADLLLVLEQILLELGLLRPNGRGGLGVGNGRGGSGNSPVNTNLTGSASQGMPRPDATGTRSDQEQERWRPYR